MARRRTGLVWHERCMWHDHGKYSGIMPADYPIQPLQHHENPDTKRRLKNLLDASGFTSQLAAIDARAATEEELLRVHVPEYLEMLEQSSAENGGVAGLDAPFTRGGYDIARLAAGGCVEAVEAVVKGEVDNAYCLIRPIGHHAEPDQGKGFCLLNNGCIAGMHALESARLDRVAFVDWDVHHGNGAQRVFWTDPRALTISLHQPRYFPPDSGDMTEIGDGNGEGFNINVPMPPGSGWGAYEATLDRVVVPALRMFEPQMIIVLSGYDTGVQDPLGRMLMHSEGFRQMTKKLLAVANEFSNDRLVVIQEGGYDETTVPFMGLAVIEELCGQLSGVVDPFIEIFKDLEGQKLQSHQDSVIVEAEKLLVLLREQCACH